MMKYIVFISIVFTLMSCNKRLDGFLFNNSTIDAYYLDEYEGEKTFALTETYDIDDSLIHLFSFPIDDNGEVLEIQAIYVGDLNTIDEDTVLLYCHGNKDHMDFYWNRQKLLAHTGGKNRVGILTFDYPGFGLSEGNPTEENMYGSTKGALQWLKDSGVDSEQLFIYGYSLGSAPATKVCSSPDEFPLKPQALILENPFASSEVMVQSSAGMAFPDSYFTDIKIANAEEIKKVEQPFLWFHGTGDTFLAIEKHGEVIYQHYQGESSRAVRVEGATHDGETGVPKKLGLENYLNEMELFIFGE